MPDAPSDKTATAIAVCQVGGDYVPAGHITDGRCFMDCDCTPRIYIALDAAREALDTEAEDGGLLLVGDAVDALDRLKESE